MQQYHSYSRRASLNHASSIRFGGPDAVAAVSGNRDETKIPGLTDAWATSSEGPFSTVPSLPYRPTWSTVLSHYQAQQWRDERRMLDPEEEYSLATPPAAYREPPQLGKDYIPGPPGLFTLGPLERSGDLKALAREKRGGLRIDTSVANHTPVLPYNVVESPAISPKQVIDSPALSPKQDREYDADSEWTASPTASFLLGLLPEPEPWSPTLQEWIEAGACSSVARKPTPKLTGKRQKPLTAVETGVDHQYLASSEDEDTVKEMEAPKGLRKPAHRFCQVLGQDGDEISVLLKTPKPSVQDLKGAEEAAPINPPKALNFEWPEGRRNSINYEAAKFLGLDLADLHPIRREPEENISEEPEDLEVRNHYPMRTAPINRAPVRGLRRVPTPYPGVKATKKVTPVHSNHSSMLKMISALSMPAHGIKPQTVIAPAVPSHGISPCAIPDDYEVRCRDKPVTGLRESGLEILKKMVEAQGDMPVTDFQVGGVLREKIEAYDAQVRAEQEAEIAAQNLMDHGLFSGSADERKKAILRAKAHLRAAKVEESAKNRVAEWFGMMCVGKRCQSAQPKSPRMATFTERRTPEEIGKDQAVLQMGEGDDL